MNPALYRSKMRKYFNRQVGPFNILNPIRLPDGSHGEFQGIGIPANFPAKNQRGGFIVRYTPTHESPSHAIQIPDSITFDGKEFPVSFEVKKELPLSPNAVSYRGYSRSSWDW